MMKRFWLATAMMTIIALVACPAFAGDTGKTADKKSDKAAEQTATKAIDWKELGKFIPGTIDDYTADSLDGGTMSMADPDHSGRQLSHSTAQRTFMRETSDGATMGITVAIMDAGLAQMLLQTYLTQAQMEYDGPEGSMKAIEIDGRPATQRIQYGESAIDQAVVFTILKNRVVVAISGDGMEDSEPVLDVAKAIDYDGLEKLIR